MTDTRPRVLVIEDDPLIARLIGKILETEGFEADKAGDGKAGCARADDQDFDLIVLDFNLPDIDGTEVLRRLNASPRSCKTPILLTTAHSKMPFDRAKFGDRPLLFLEKPFERRQLIEKVREILRQRDAWQLTSDLQ